MGNYSNTRSPYSRGGRYSGRRYNGCQSCQNTQNVSETACTCRSQANDDTCTCRNTASAFPHPPDQVLAMAYVPFQTFGDLYDVPCAFQAGTLFAALDKPFRGGRCV